MRPRGRPRKPKQPAEGGANGRVSIDAIKRLPTPFLSHGTWRALSVFRHMLQESVSMSSNHCGDPESDSQNRERSHSATARLLERRLRDLAVAAFGAGLTLVYFLKRAASVPFPERIDIVVLLSLVILGGVVSMRIHGIVATGRMRTEGFLARGTREWKAFVMSGFEAFLVGLACAACILLVDMLLRFAWTWNYYPNAERGIRPGTPEWALASGLLVAILAAALLAWRSFRACLRWMRAFRDAADRML